ncbi:hypothetical protein GQ464_000050 [Rhodocaloribacter litoris]|uniref:hypothetical protein n=1 Tax=Rhodocaloribacter litoris TaxID=2558931 RepID=UPI00142458AB|nr:hypothetical protein [Rhodocaloribacter litoris]QXD15386.1 hypothetical protein GQ464_000050 [Rhodocaloribacter litoris]
MKALLYVISFLGLALTVVPAFLVFAGAIPWETHATLMFAGTVAWFVTAPFWMHTGSPDAPANPAP